MIVRDEAATIESVLATWKPYIDRYCIVDTGSKDDTPLLVSRALAEFEGYVHTGLPFEFKDFSTNRNQALELAREQGCEFLVMPNGDRLEGGEQLRAFLEAHRTADYDAFRVRIAPGHYYHPLIMRSGGDWKWSGRTHEYLTGGRLGPQIEGVSLVRDRSHRTKEQWLKRWKRDLELLHLDRLDDRSNSRPLFYLGQTHECIADAMEAGEADRIKHLRSAERFYRERAKVGGYFDEAYEAQFRLARVIQKIGDDWLFVMDEYLKAHAFDPRRAEPLYEIAKHYHDENNHAMTYLFASRAAGITKPSTDLFLDEEVYTWKSADLASISGYYIGEKKAGVEFAEKALRAWPGDQRLRANRSFYARAASEIFLDRGPKTGYRVVTIQCPVPAVGTTPKRVAMNPSIMRYGGEWTVNVRLVNYRILGGRYFVINQDKPEELHNADDHHPIDTINVVCDLDRDFNVIRSTTITERPGAVPERTNFPVHGFEDLRIFRWADDRVHWHAFATARDLSPDGKAEQCLLTMDPETWEIVDVKVLRGPWSDQHQKNWLPFEFGTRILYSSNPMQILSTRDVVKGQWHVKPLLGGDLRGGGGVVTLRGDRRGFDPRFDSIWIVHESIDFGGGRTYLHRFIGQRADGKLKMSEPFYFVKRGIEFCCGLDIDDGNSELVASFSVDDATAQLAIFDVRAVLATLIEDVP